MNHDPYAAPQAPPSEGPGDPIPTAPQPWETSEVLSEAWRIFTVHWPVLVLSVLVTTAIVMLPTIVLFGVKIRAGGWDPKVMEEAGRGPLANAVSCLDQILGAFFTAGLVRINLTAARGGAPRLMDLFSGANAFLPMLGVTILTGLACACGVLLFIVPGVILFCGLWASSYYVVDAKLGVIDSMKASWDAMQGQKGDILVFLLVTILINVGGFFTCCVGFFLTAPVMALAVAIVFLRVSGRGVPGPPAPFVMPFGYDGPR